MLATLVSVTVILGGAHAIQTPATPGVVAFEDAIRVVDRISLHETENVLNVVPEVALDPEGGFLVADMREAQARVYDSEGNLLWYGGRKGGGPGEFENLRLARRLPDGTLLCADRSARFTIFDPITDKLIGTVRTPFFHVEDVDVRGEASLLVSAMLEGDQFGPRIHVWDLESETVVHSFFSPFENAPNKSAATFAGWTRVAVHGDSLAAVFATSDTVYVLAGDGGEGRNLPLPSTRYRPVPHETPTGRMTPPEQAEWLASFDLVSDVWWLDSGTILVQYLSLLPDPRLSQRDWHLVAISPSGELIAEIRNIPRILAVDEASGRMFMQSPVSEMPGDWIVGEPKVW
jgi:hypothetical protein